VCQAARSWVTVGSVHKRLFGDEYVTFGDFHEGSLEGTARNNAYCHHHHHHHHCHHFVFALQKGFNLRIKEIHLVNMPSFSDVILRLMKMVLKPKLLSRVSNCSGLSWLVHYTFAYSNNWIMRNI
jgi:hypothetical protein